MGLGVRQDTAIRGLHALDSLLRAEWEQACQHSDLLHGLVNVWALGSGKTKENYVNPYFQSYTLSWGMLGRRNSNCECAFKTKQNKRLSLQ